MRVGKSINVLAENAVSQNGTANFPQIPQVSHKVTTVENHLIKVNSSFIPAKMEWKIRGKLAGCSANFPQFSIPFHFGWLAPSLACW